MITREQAINIFNANDMKHQQFSRACGLNKGAMWDIIHRGNKPTNITLEKIESYARQNGLLPEQTGALNKAILNALSVPVSEDPFTLGNMAAALLVIVLAAITLILFLVGAK